MKYTVIIGLICLASCSLAQEQSGLLSKIDRFGAYYHADFGIYPGIGLFLENPLSTKHIKRGKKPIHILRVLSLRPNLRYYVHPRVNSVLNPAILFYYASGREKGLFYELEIGMGYWAQFNNGVAYSLDGNEIVSHHLTLRSYVNLETNIGLGYRMKNENAFFAKISTSQQFPYNSIGFLPRFLLQLGFSKALNK